MMRSYLFIIFILIAASCFNKKDSKISIEMANDTPHSASANKSQTAESYTLEGYGDDTLLKGGYSIQFTIENNTQNLYLKGNKIRKRIANCAIGSPYKALGYLVADFRDFFVLAHSFGSGNPTYIDLIEKTTGRNILDKNAMLVDANVDEGILFYSTEFYPAINDRLILVNIRSKQKKALKFPEKSIGLSLLESEISIVKVTAEEVAIKYKGNDRLQRTMRYKR
jgi:hypothetical protein